VCRRKIILLHLLLSVATTFPKPLERLFRNSSHGWSPQRVTTAAARFIVFTILMRLEPQQIESIKRQTAKWAPGADAFVFGSRTDPSARGGDIDLLVLAEEKLSLGTLRHMRRAILDEIGEQKLDIVSFARAAAHPFKDIALVTARKL
jgi:predicted nucleotidyltransferase